MSLNYGLQQYYFSPPLPPQMTYDSVASRWNGTDKGNPKNSERNLSVLLIAVPKTQGGIVAYFEFIVIFEGLSKAKAERSRPGVSTHGPPKCFVLPAYTFVTLYNSVSYKVTSHFFK
jgi:hypothetical protein